MKQLFINTLVGLIPIIGIAIFIAISIGFAYILSITPTYVWYIVLGILFISVLERTGNSIVKEIKQIRRRNGKK